MSSTAASLPKPRKRGKGIYMKNVLSRKISLPFKSIGSNIKVNIKKILESNLYGKCAKEGYIRKNSINILSFSSGVVDADFVLFDVIFECLVCHPVEGQIIKCKVKNITRAGIRAIYAKEDTSPITIFIARDHHYNNEFFSKIKEDQDIVIRVIGIRYELNDQTISILGELKLPKKKPKTKVTIVEE